MSRIGVPGQVELTAAGPQPAAITIQAGRTVTWLNGDSVPHQIVSDEPGLFDTGIIAPGASAQTSFQSTGSHAWHDPNSAVQRGVVTVLP